MLTALTFVNVELRGSTETSETGRRCRRTATGHIHATLPVPAGRFMWLAEDTTNFDTTADDENCNDSPGT
jgi:hypothetical protein